MKCLQWEPSCSMRLGGRTDRHDYASSRFSQYFERAKKSRYKVFRLSMWNVLHVALVASRILRRFLRFLENLVILNNHTW
jgi:hypothetical protein